MSVEFFKNFDPNSGRKRNCTPSADDCGFLMDSFQNFVLNSGLNSSCGLKIWLDLKKMYKKENRNSNMQQNIIYKIRRLHLQFKQSCQNIKIAKSSGVSFCIQGQQSRYLAGKTPKRWATSSMCHCCCRCYRRCCRCVLLRKTQARQRQIQFWSCQSYLQQRPLIRSNLTILFQILNVQLGKSLALIESKPFLFNY